MRLGTLLVVFLRIGTFGFGGIGAALALIERDLVERRALLTRDDLTEALTYTKLLPGSTVVQVVSYIGYQLAGWPGSATATVAFVLPSAVAMIGLAALYGAAATLPNLAPTISGLVAAVVGLLLATTYRLGRSNIKERLTLLIAGAALVAGVLLNAPAALVVVGGGLIGVICLRDAPAGRGGRERTGSTAP